MRTILCVAALALATGSLCAQAATPTPVPALCPITAQPIPSGITARPADAFNSEQDYRWMHSSTNLQGYATKEKFAPCLFYNPGDDDISKQLGRFRSALVVNNPSPTLTANVQVELRDRNGNLLTTLPVTLPPNGTWTRGVPELQSLSTGVGSARIVSDQPIVGSSLHYLDSVNIGGTTVTDPDFLHPGEGTMQQLQASQANALNLYAGPMPLATSTSFDFLNGNLPFYCVLNTTPTPTTVTSFKGTSGGISLPTTTSVLPGYGMFIDLAFWNAAEGFYLSSPGAFDDNGWAFVASSTSPVVGDLYMTDFFGGASPTGAMSLGRKFRAGSAMMANTPALVLTNAELTEQLGPASPQVDTLMGVLNATTVDIGPVTVTYRNRNGGVAGTNTVASLLPGQTLRFTPGTPGFPAAPFFDGWTEVRACRAGLIGWTMREITKIGGASHFEKVYGEEMVGANGLEPGKGMPVVQSGIAVNRKVAPIARVSPFLAWPSYTNFVNHSSANNGNYWYRFFQVLPLSGDVTNYAPQPFGGLRFANTSFTYQDGANSLVNIGFDQNVSGRVDVSTGSVIGITAIGDPMDEWQIPMYPGN